MKIEYKIQLFQNWISLIMLAIIFSTSSFAQGSQNANTDQIKLK